MAYRARVTRVQDDGKVYVSVPGLGIGGDFGPLAVDQKYLVGDRVIVDSLYGARELLALIGKQEPTIRASVTAGRPAANTVEPGFSWFDTTLGKPIWSDGTVWVDAMGDLA